MEIKTIKVLLKKYLEGKTSLNDESVLRNYFNHEQNLPEEWIHYRQFFTYFEKSKNESFSISKTNSYNNKKIWIRVAASIALLIGIYLIDFFETQPRVLEQQEAEFAFQQFQTHMKNISTHLNNGAQKVSYLDYWNKSTQKLLK
tara:strand:+ start:719 stop:1150 length:432 start_codon:yes stop_codon:yes gene_type:complete